MRLNKIIISIIITILIIQSSVVVVDYTNYLEKNNKKEYEITDYKMIKFEIEEKPPKTIPLKQETDSERYRESLYEYFEKIEKLRDKPIRK